MAKKSKKLTQEISFVSTQDRQDDIFRKMPAEKKLKLASDFSMFLIKLNKSAPNYGLSRTLGNHRQNPRRS